MAHVHAKDGNYFIEQLCTIGVCGALGGVAITMWAIPNGLFFLGPQFQAPFGEPWLSPVLWGGIAIVTFVLIRAVAVWISVGKSSATDSHDHTHEHNHDHAHEHDLANDAHDHDHAHDHAHVHADPMPHTHSHDHNHDNGHDHGWAPWRYVILLLPVGLYFLHLIPSEFKSHAKVSTDLGGTSAAPADKDDGEPIGGFLELGRASSTPESRKYYEGRKAHVTGQAVVNVDSRRFGLVRYKISCCAADAIPLNMVVEVPDDTDEGKKFNAQALQSKWVDVTGRIEFRTLRGTEEFVTVLRVNAKELTVLPKTPSNPFVY